MLRRFAQLVDASDRSVSRQKYALVLDALSEVLGRFSRDGHDEHPNEPVAVDRESVWDVARKKDESVWSHLKRLIATSDGQVAMQDIEDLVLLLVDVDSRLVAFAHEKLHERDAALCFSGTGLDGEQILVPGIAPAFTRLQD